MRLVAFAAALFTIGCSAEGPKSQQTLSIRGSDTLVQVATAWAETYSAKAQGTGVSVSASGGGSGTGIAGIIDGTIDIATSSREITTAERASIRTRRGAEVIEHVVGLDALAIYVHPDNPIDAISIPDLQEMWAEDGELRDWSQLHAGIVGPIVLIGRQNSSGTYDYFREIVCGKTEAGVSREFRGGVSELNGSSEVVEKISKARLALGYTGMGYKNDRVKWLAVSRERGGPAVTPSIESARSGDYPLARKLYLYTVGEPSADLAELLEWTVSAEGQAIVAREGYVPAHE